MTANNKTNEEVNPQKAHSSSKDQNCMLVAALLAIRHLSPHRIEPKPTTGSVANGVWMTLVRLVGVPLGNGYRQWAKATGHHGLLENISSFATDMKNLGKS